MDEADFAALTEPYHRELHVHCYRMVGSLTDADDLLQETLLAAWRGYEGFAARASLRTWLYRIATNRCLNAIRDRARRPPLAPAPPFDVPEPTRHAEVTWVQPYPDAGLADPQGRYEAGENIRLAFVTALQRLPPRQTAAVVLCDVLDFPPADVLCDVLDFPPADVATMLATTPTAVKGLLQRARGSLAGADLATGGQDPVPGAGEESEVARRFAEAYGADDVDAVVRLLTDEGWLAMPPAPHIYVGPAAVAAFLAASAAGRDGRHFTLEATSANGQPAFATHLGPEPSGLIVLEVAGSRLAGITRFLDPALPERFRRAGPRPLPEAARAGRRCSPARPWSPRHPSG